jgi:hypothetical protein
MTSAAAHLEVLPGGRSQAGEDTDWLRPTPAAGGDTGPASVWDPEHQLVGALMWLPLEVARRITALVPAEAIHTPMTRWSYEIICTQPCTIAADSTAAPSASRHHQLSVYLARAYTETVCPDNAPSYAREVLDNAYRRAFTACGQRMQILAESEAGRTEMTETFAAVRAELLEWWRRAEAAAQPVVTTS